MVCPFQFFLFTVFLCFSKYFFIRFYVFFLIQDFGFVGVLLFFLGGVLGLHFRHVYWFFYGFSRVPQWLADLNLLLFLLKAMFFFLD